MVTQIDEKETEIKEPIKLEEESLSETEGIGRQYMYEEIIRKYGIKEACILAVDLALRRSLEIYTENTRKYGHIVFWGEQSLMIPDASRIYYIGERMKKRLCKRKINLPEKVEKETFKELVKYFENEAMHYEMELDKIEERMQKITPSLISYIHINMLKEREVKRRMYLIYSETARELKKILKELYNVEIRENV